MMSFGTDVKHLKKVLLVAPWTSMVLASMKANNLGDLLSDDDDKHGYELMNRE